MPLTNVDWPALAVPIPVTVVFAALSWSACRGINGGKPLSAYQRGLLLYGTLFVLGLTASMGVAGAFRWPRWAWIVPSMIWASAIGLAAWRNGRTKKS